VQQHSTGEQDGWQQTSACQFNHGIFLVDNTGVVGVAVGRKLFFRRALHVAGVIL
jgi:hypothetical protein